MKSRIGFDLDETAQLARLRLSVEKDKPGDLEPRLIGQQDFRRRVATAVKVKLEHQAVVVFRRQVPEFPFENEFMAGHEKPLAEEQDGEAAVALRCRKAEYVAIDSRQRKVDLLEPRGVANQGHLVAQQGGVFEPQVGNGPIHARYKSAKSPLRFPERNCSR